MAGSLVSIAGWLDGYLTAQNETREKTFDLVPWQNTELLLSALGSWCRTRPQDTLHTAAFRLVESLASMRLTERSPQLAVGSGAAAIHLYAAVIERIQQRLKMRGMYAGEPGGEFDAATADALRRFQREKKLPETGLPDQLTLANLL